MNDCCLKIRCGFSLGNSIVYMKKDIRATEIITIQSAQIFKALGLLFSAK